MYNSIYKKRFTPKKRGIQESELLKTRSLSYSWLIKRALIFINALFFFNFINKYKKMNSDPFKVSDPYRTNPLSVDGGGVSVMVQLIDGKIREYDKIKMPFAYMKKLRLNPSVKKTWIKGEKPPL